MATLPSYDHAKQHPLACEAKATSMSAAFFSEVGGRQFVN
jgi:hypothetical protein